MASIGVGESQTIGVLAPPARVVVSLKLMLRFDTPSFVVMAFSAAVKTVYQDSFVDCCAVKPMPTGRSNLKSLVDIWVIDSS